MNRENTARRLGLTATCGADCASLTDVREALDGIDAEIIALLAMRLDYVRNAAQFKPDLASIPAPERVGEMLEQRAEWAIAEDIAPDFIAPLFAQIIQWNIRQQIAHWHATRTR